MSDVTTIQSRSPQEPSRVVAEVPALSTDEVHTLANAARSGQYEWQAMTGLARAEILGQVARAVAAAADELSTAIVVEVGKPVAEAEAEVRRAAAVFSYFAEQALAADGESYPTSGPRHSLLLARRHARGLVGLVTPWNFPLLIPAWKIAPALAYGNAALWKPSEEAVGCAQLIHDLIAVHLPPGLLALAPGGPTTGRAVIGAADAVSFTGSVGVGQEIIHSATERFVTVQAEMGGLNASIVMPDADREHAARTIAAAAMDFAGQKCTATSRVIVVGPDDGFREALASEVRALSPGDPSLPQTRVGPVISRTARERVLQAVRVSLEQGGSLVTGGAPLGGDGWYVEPTLVSDVPRNSLLANEEVFGPISAIMDAVDFDDAVSLTNATRYGLTTAVFTNDLSVALAAAERVNAGMVRVNSPSTGAEHYAPFGGEGDSSYGAREQGTAAREFYTSTKTVSINLPPAG